MSLPDITIRQATAPYNAITLVSFFQTAPDGSILPVLKGHKSDKIRFRIYNNFAGNTGVIDAFNVFMTTWDGISPSSHTAIKNAVASQWTHFKMTGFGEDSVPPGLFTYYEGVDTAVGGSSVYNVEKGSNGNSSLITLRAGSDTSGVGFIEVESYLSIPDNAVAETVTFAISVNYEYTT